MKDIIFFVITAEALEGIITPPQACCLDKTTGTFYKSDETFINTRKSYTEYCKCHITGKITCQKTCRLIRISSFLIVIFKTGSFCNKKPKLQK